MISCIKLDDELQWDWICGRWRSCWLLRDEQRYAYVERGI